MAYNRVEDFLGQTVSGITTTFEFDRLGHIQRRYTAQGYGDYIYAGDTDWLARETWHAATSGNTFNLMYYHYINGRPRWVQVARVSSDWQSRTGLSTYYLQSNWRGDVEVWVASDGNGSNTITVTTDPWGVYGGGG